MAGKIDTSMKATKGKVKKYDGANLSEIQEAYWRCTDAEQDALTSALSEYVDMGFDSFLEDIIFNAANILDGVEKSQKSMSTAQMIKTLRKMGYTVAKEESEEETEETVEEDEESEDGDVDVDVEVDKGCTQSKNFTRKSRTGKSAKRNARGCVKAEDKGPDAEEVEDEAIGSENAVKVPDTPEPSDNVEEVETKVPEIDALEEDGVKTEETGAKEGNDMDALEDEGITTQDIADMDIDALIEKKRRQMMKDSGQVPPAHTQPFANNYRTVQMGQGKGQVPAGALGKSNAGKGMVGSRKRI